jgi:hypothetical protein
MARAYRDDEDRRCREEIEAAQREGMGWQGEPFTCEAEGCGRKYAFYWSAADFATDVPSFREQLRNLIGREHPGHATPQVIFPLM